MKITENEKSKIAEAAQHYVARYDSQNQAAATLSGVSSATLSQVINGKHGLISKNMWRNLLAALSYNPNEEVVLKTAPFNKLSSFLADAKKNKLALGVVGEAGTGKSFAIKFFESTERNVVVLSCREYWNRKWFLQELLIKLGRPYHGLTIAEMMSDAVSRLLVTEDPIIVFDEYDKLPEHVFSFFVTLYNELEDRCGFLIIATDHLRKRIKRGLALNKKGYNEFNSRLGRRLLELPQPNSEDITMICMANGITDRKKIKAIIDDSDWDLRRVKRKMHAIKAKRENDQIAKA